LEAALPGSGPAGALLEVLGPVAAGLFAVGALVVLVRAGGRAAAFFPWAAAGACLAYLGAGAFWSSFVGAAATLAALAAVFYAPDGVHQIVLVLDAAALWGCFGQLLRADLDHKTASARREDRLARMRLEISRRAQEAGEAGREAVSIQERIAAYNRLRFFADDLIGAYSRDELAARAQGGLSALFLRSRTRVALFPSSGEPTADDELGRWSLRQGGGGLYADRFGRLPSKGAGRFLLAPLRVRDSVIGWMSLERAAGDRLYDFQDFRLALIAADLVAMALGNAERYSQIESLAISDGLTGVYTRGYLNERLQEEFAKARHQERPLSLMILDLDRFKRINDAHGHRLGDEVLRWLARQVTAQCRDTDFVARYGGEEFVVLMPNTKASDALSFARRLGKAVESTAFRWDNVSLKITLSGGVAAMGEGVDNEMELLRRADQALYQAKETGRNKVCLYG
jgi:diguanylate cyclase (GGDEF)-like protein